MKKILTFNQLLETKEKKESWMPSVEEFDNIEPYKSLLEALGGHADIRGTYQSKASITKGVRFIRIGATYECKVSPTNSGSERVNFTYGAYKIYSDKPFGTKEEQEKAMELFVLYSIGKRFGYSINQGIFGGVSKYLTGERSKIYLEKSDMEEMCEALIRNAEAINNPNIIRKTTVFIISSYLLSKYFPGPGNVAIFRAISIMQNQGERSKIKEEIIKGMLKYASMEHLCKYMEDNPLELYLLDDFPEIKSEVLQKTGMKDYSSIGRKLKKGMI